MQPAYSVIFFTTAAGAGYGLLFILVLNATAVAIPLRPVLLLSGLTLAGLLVTAGLLSSTLHLGHPERAWRAFSQWRSSWLSREGVLAVVVYPVALGWAWLVWSATGRSLTFNLLSLLLALLAALTVYATGQIYASLKAVPAWHRASVPTNYLLLALMSGAQLMHALQLGLSPRPAASAALVPASIALAALGKAWYWWRIDRAPPPSTLGSATGLGAFGTVSVLTQPHTEENYLQREMGFVLARKHAWKLRVLAALGMFVVPLLAYLAGGLSCTVLGALAMAVGLFIERWLFFAQAKHRVMLFYGGLP
ncbi:MAG: dimethyl sulfoxide reductase anchor subunit [Gammaproteobacteria bacterium]|nr:dimethyl sulfoxide reductase anchor subunit [Gammaproteobacteria bacterium]